MALNIETPNFAKTDRFEQPGADASKQFPKTSENWKQN